MKLVLKIALGILLAVVILWAAQIGFVVALVAGVRQALGGAEPPTSRHSVLSAPNISKSAPPFFAEKTVERKPQLVGYRDEWVPGKPLEQCVGEDKELNENVMRCRSGYNRRVPIYR